MWGLDFLDDFLQSIQEGLHRIRSLDGLNSPELMTEDGRIIFSLRYHLELMTAEEAIDFLIDREPVGTIDEDIRNIVRRRIDALKVTGQASKWTSERELEAIAYALWKHRENQACYRYVRTGMTTGLCVDCGSTKKMHAGRLEREEKGAHEYHPSEEKEA